MARALKGERKVALTLIILPSDSPLWDVPNLLITPHISCDDGEHYVDISLHLWFENLGRFLRGKPLLRRVDPRRGY